MSDKITVTVLPEKQLRHVLRMSGYRKNSNGNYIHTEKQYCHSDIFTFCGQEIAVTKSGMLDDGYQLGSNFFLKSWFVPYTLHGKTTDVKEPEIEDWTGKTREVGDIFPCNGVMLEVVDEVDACNYCHYFRTGIATCTDEDIKTRGECYKHKRSTGKGCIYVKLDE